MAEDSDTDHAKAVPEKSTQGTPTSAPSLRIKTLLVILLALITVLALALGLGLGLGLKHHHGNKSSSTTNSTTSSNEGLSFASFDVQPLRQSTLDYGLDIPSWDFNAVPTTRIYNFTLTESFGAPDGKRINCQRNIRTDC